MFSAPPASRWSSSNAIDGFLWFWIGSHAEYDRVVDWRCLSVNVDETSPAGARKRTVPIGEDPDGADLQRPQVGLGAEQIALEVRCAQA